MAEGVGFSPSEERHPPSCFSWRGRIARFSALAWKAGRPKRPREVKSLPLRHFSCEQRRRRVGSRMVNYDDRRFVYAKRRYRRGSEKTSCGTRCPVFFCGLKPDDCCLIRGEVA